MCVPVAEIEGIDLEEHIRNACMDFLHQIYIQRVAEFELSTRDGLILSEPKLFRSDFEYSALHFITHHLPRA